MDVLKRCEGYDRKLEVVEGKRNSFAARAREGVVILLSVRYC